MLETLTLRQVVIMELLVMGGGNEEIADVLKISSQTVKVHVWRLFKRLGVNSRIEAVGLWRAAQIEFDQSEQDKLRAANEAMLSALQWLASNRDAEPIAITGVLTSAIAAGSTATGS